ncbi:MAG: hypothetical protein K2M34_00955 [Alphaproteobacteria bacterium]|nr:hypothetical protein [Alphaproteobacteria bacterium]
MKSKIKKTLLISGIAVLGLMGIKYSYTTKDEDNTKKIEYAQNALTRINQELASDSLNPEERHELILTRNEIQKEVNKYSKNKKQDNDVDISTLNARLNFARNTLARIEEELKSDTINPEERHELMLTRANVRREIQELSQQLSGTAQAIAPKSNER